MAANVWWGLPCPWERPALALSFAEQTLPLEDFCRSVIGTNNKARGFPLFDVKSPPFPSISGFSPWDREVHNGLGPPMRHRCVYCCQISCQFDSCRCSSRGPPAMAHAHGETINTESPDLSPPVLATFEDQRPISTTLQDIGQASVSWFRGGSFLDTRIHLLAPTAQRLHFWRVVGTIE